MIRLSKADKILGKVQSGIQLLEKGYAIGNTLYKVGKTVAPLAAAMV